MPQKQYTRGKSVRLKIAEYRNTLILGLILISFLKIPGIGIGIDIFLKNCQYWYWCWDRIEEYLVLVSVLVLTLKIPRIDIDIDIVILSYRMKQQYPLKRAGIAHLWLRP